MAGTGNRAMTLPDFLLARIAEDETHWHTVDGSWVRMLAECEAKRRIVELHHLTVGSVRAYGARDGQVVIVEPDSFEDIVSRSEHCANCHNFYPGGPCRTLQLLAQPYADHADYRDEWRP